MNNEEKNTATNKAKAEFYQAYQAGQVAFEGGEYRLAVSYSKCQGGYGVK